MWFIISGDGDIDYTNVYGPYPTEAAAEQDLPEDTDDIRYRTVELQNPSDLKEDATEQAEAAEPLLMDTDPISAHVAALIAKHGSVEAIPAPDSQVQLWASWQLQQASAALFSALENKNFFEVGEGKAILDLMKAFPFEDESTEQTLEEELAEQGDEIGQAKVDADRYAQLLIRHTPADEPVSELVTSTARFFTVPEGESPWSTFQTAAAL